jgi:hypothetical protein
MSPEPLLPPLPPSANAADALAKMTRPKAGTVRSGLFIVPSKDLLSEQKGRAADCRVVFEV